MSLHPRTGYLHVNHLLQLHNTSIWKCIDIACFCIINRQYAGDLVKLAHCTTIGCHPFLKKKKSSKLKNIYSGIATNSSVTWCK